MDIRRSIGFRKAQDETVLAPHGLHVQTCRFDLRGRCHGPGRVHFAAERRQTADTPVAKLIAHALDHNRAVIRHLLRREFLVGQIAQHVLRRLSVQIVLACESCDCGSPRHRTQLAHQRADPAAKFDGPPRLVTMPERHLARLTRRGAHQHAVMGNLIHAPR